jgi:hypothetical protein
VRADFVGEHSHFDIAAKAASLLRHILPALVALPVEAMLRHICRCKALIRAGKPSHTAERYVKCRKFFGKKYF